MRLGCFLQVYIPVESTSADEGRGDGLIHVLLNTKDEAILKTVKELRAVTGGGGGWFGELKRLVEAGKKREGEAKQETKNPAPAADAGFEKAMLFMGENLDKLVINRPVRGLIQFGLDSNHGDRQRIQSQDSKIARDFAVLEDGAQPQFLGSLFMVIAGLGLTLLLIAGAAAKTGSSIPHAPGSPGASAPPAGPELPIRAHPRGDPCKAFRGFALDGPSAAQVAPKLELTKGVLLEAKSRVLKPLRQEPGDLLR